MTTDDRVALVTGAASEIGAATARSLAKSVRGLVLVDRNRDGLEAVVKGISGPDVLALDFDVGSEAPWAVSDAAGNMTGSLVVSDGGYTL